MNPLIYKIKKGTLRDSLLEYSAAACSGARPCSLPRTVGAEPDEKGETWRAPSAEVCVCLCVPHLPHVKLGTPTP